MRALRNMMGKRWLGWVLALVAVLVLAASAIAAPQVQWLTIEMQPVEAEDGADEECQLDVRIRAVDGSNDDSEPMAGVEVTVTHGRDTVATEATAQHGSYCYAQFILDCGETYTFQVSKDGYYDRTVRYTMPEVSNTSSSSAQSSPTL